jgi:hypothetical protein
MSPQGPPSSRPDTAAVNQTVRAFFSWYRHAIDTDQTTEFQPRFVADAQGRMTLDLSRYLGNLRRLHFSQALIQQEAAAYQPCINNLRRIPFAQRDSLLDDVADYEDMDCAFFDSYRWTHTMDTYQGIRLHRTRATSDSARVWVQPYEYYPDNEPAKRYYLWEGYLQVRLTRRAGTWEIDAIN